jgi:geranylgeranyl diphosphate synthase type I
VDTVNWVNRVNEHITTILENQRATLSHLGNDVTAFTDFAAEMLAGGKRFRAQFCAMGYACASTEFPSSLWDVAAGLELFHAAALAHDDIMDKSDTRRGIPAAHRFFEQSHRTGGWAGDSEHFGVSSALLFGDFLLALSDLAVARGFRDHADRDASFAARLEFDQMRLDVTAGQYLDIVEENAWPTVTPADALGRAQTVLTYKSAKYSIEAPVVIGASLAGASPTVIASLREFAVPLGNAFQLRDDILGVFGDPAVTGKPVGDDLSEGKRTVLIALAMQKLTEPERASLNSALGSSALTLDDIARIQQQLEATGARAAVELMISDEFERSMSALESAELTDDTKTALRSLAERVVVRSA